MTLHAATVIAEIKRKNGNLAAVAVALKVSRMTIYRFLQQHPTAREALQDARETMLDLAESGLYDKVIGRDLDAIKFFLTTQGRSRGYTTRQDVVTWTPEQLQAMSDEEFDAVYAQQSRRA